MRRFALALISFSLMLSPHVALATDGYFSLGYGMQSNAMGGASTALALDSFGGANNPASMAAVGNRFDIGLTLFSPQRSATRTGLGPGLDGSSQSRSTLFLIPEFGYNRSIGPRATLGVTVYGNGGLNTNYAGGTFDCGQGPANMLCGNGTLGVNLIQVIVAPTFAVRLGSADAIGIAPLLGWQQFAAQGLQAFQALPNFSVAPAKITNTGASNSSGIGVRLGYQHHFAGGITLGASYAPRMSMSAFDGYQGLFAGSGSFDIPENYSIGVAIAPARGPTLAIDYERIAYSAIPAVGDPSTNRTQLGSPRGPGFGWQDVGVVKVGIAQHFGDAWTVRAGYNHGSNPIQARDVTFNILAPGVVADHLTFGITHARPGAGQVTIMYAHAFNNAVSGASLLPAFLGGAPAGTETIQMYQNSIGIGYGRSF